MGIKFSPKQWDNVIRNHDLFWDNKLDRHIIYMELEGVDPKRDKPNTPLIDQATCADFSLSADDIIDRVDYELSTREYLGDAFPKFDLSCFGPGVMAAFMGATLDNSTSRVWFHPKEELPIADIHFEYDADNIWLNRIRDIYQAGVKRWQGQVLLGMPDIGGSLDVLSSFRPSEKLLFDLYDNPNEVKRLLAETHELWFKYYNEFADIMFPTNKGYTEWGGIYSSKPSYFLQCDFSYMIGPDMFKEFVLDELAESAAKLTNPSYHLDGVGELNHIDMILDIPNIKLIQWVPGDGTPDQSNWPELYNKIFGAGKLAQVFGELDVMDTIIQQTGITSGIQKSPIVLPITERDEAMRILRKYNVE